VRTFIAIELDEELRENLGSLQARLRGEMPPRSVRWVRPTGIHLTLKFLGNTPVYQIQKVCEALDRAAREITPFTMTVVDLGCFPNPRRPRVVWVGIREATGALARLRDEVEAHVSPLGFPRERRRFHPHLTLGRVQRRATPADVRRIGQVASSALVGQIDEIDISGVSYIQSELRPGGAVYTTLHEARLAGGQHTPTTE
jgi:2'-5' RNA ligase